MTPLAIHDLERLQAGITETWKSFDLSRVNGNAARLRVMERFTANWHVHDASDELFYVISGTVVMDTEDGPHELRAGQLFIVPTGLRHRARVEGRAVTLVIDALR